MSILSQFVSAIEWGLGLLADATGSAGLAVIIFTILFRTAVLPLTVRAVRSSYALQEIQPKLQELQARYGNDRQRLSAETLKLYQQHGINPAAGCLPMLLQMPIFFGLYFAIRSLSRSGAGAWSEPFLWLPSLAEVDPLKILPIAAGVLQLTQALMARPSRRGQTVRAQQQAMFAMTLFFPLMVVVIGLQFPAGPVLYWVTSATFGVVQQWLTTGGGLLRDWLPFLPEIPEHRRLGYIDPATRAAAAANRQQPWLFRQLHRGVEKRIERVEAERARREAESLDDPTV